MDFNEFEKLIGKDIAHANHILLDEGFGHKNLIDFNLYSTFDNYKWFYGTSYNIISITTNETQNCPE